MFHSTLARKKSSSGIKTGATVKVVRFDRFVGNCCSVSASIAAVQS
jgi:hypothetical protein